MPTERFSGADSFVYRASDGSLQSSAAVSLVVTAAINPAIDGTTGNDTLVDTGGAARLFGLAGDDRLQGGPGDDTLDGGTGNDTAAYAQPSASFHVAKLGTGWRITDNSGVDGTDTLTGIERIAFADKTFELVIPAAARRRRSSTPSWCPTPTRC